MLAFSAKSFFENQIVNHFFSNSTYVSIQLTIVTPSYPEDPDSNDLKFALPEEASPQVLAFLTIWVFLEGNGKQ